MNLKDLTKFAQNVKRTEIANQWTYSFDVGNQRCQFSIGATVSINDGEPHTRFRYRLVANGDTIMYGDVIKAKGGGGNWSEIFAAQGELEARAILLEKEMSCCAYDILVAEVQGLKQQEKRELGK